MIAYHRTRKTIDFQRRVPLILYKGDTMEARYILPDAPEDVEWDNCKLGLTLIGGEGAAATTEREGEVEDAYAITTFTAAETEALTSGFYRFAFRVISEANTAAQIVEVGIVEVKDVNSTETDHDLRMVLEIKLALEAKLQRGDVISYSIGDREIMTMSLEELQKSLRYYEQRVARARRPRRVWPTSRGRRV